MSKRDELEIGKDELDWENAQVQEGRAHGAVVSVRLDAHEAERLRELASSLGLNMSQVLRQALADFEPSEGRLFLKWRAFTFGGVDWPKSVTLHPPRPQAESSTELTTRIQETFSG